MKKVLIISPYFPPVNAADMQRVRMSLSYFKDFGWESEVMMVHERFAYVEKDPLLLRSIPADVKIHKIDASRGFKIASTIGLRSFWQYRKEVSRLLASTHFDLIYFSTTQFPVCALGAGWYKKFKVPYVIDMQDPWYTGHYQTIKKTIKYRLIYSLHRWLERVAMNKVGGLINVSQKYISDLADTYPRLKNIPSSVIPFGGFEKDFEIAAKNRHLFKDLLNTAFVNIVCIGRGGTDLYKAIEPLFKVLTANEQLRDKIKIYFIGTSYAPAAMAEVSILPLAVQLGVSTSVFEYPERISYYHTLLTLQQADALFIPGSDDAGYNASKIHPYILARKPILAITHPDSPMIKVLQEYQVDNVYGFDEPNLADEVKGFLNKILSKTTTELPNINKNAIAKYSAQNMTHRQCELFDNVLTHHAN